MLKLEHTLKRTPFHERTSQLVPAAELAALGRPHRRRFLRPVSSIASTGRSATRAALIDVSPLMKYMIEGPDAARLLHKLTPRDIHKMAVGQVDYTGWCDDDGKLLDDGTVSRLGEQTLPPDLGRAVAALAVDERRRHGRDDHRSHRDRWRR